MVKKITFWKIIHWVIIINFLLGSLTYEKNLNLTRWLLWSSLLVQLIILTVVISLIINYFS